MSRIRPSTQDTLNTDPMMVKVQDSYIEAHLLNPRPTVLTYEQVVYTWTIPKRSF